MIRQFFILAFRNFLKDKVLSLINLTNLSISIAAFILLIIFINWQFSFDKHQKNYSQIYRVQLFMDQAQNVTSHTWSVTAALSRHDLVGLPEIEKIALIHDADDNNKDGIYFSPDKKNQVLVRYGYYSDQSVFDIFTFHFIEGNQQNALKEPFSIVLTKSLANKLFPNGKAVGKQVYGENKAMLTVTGVYDDIPLNSEFKPTYLIPITLFGDLTNWKDFETDYWGYSFYTYVLLKPNADPAMVDAKIKYALKDYRKEHYPYLRPLSQLHLNAFYQKDMYVVVSLFSLSALLILLLAAFNFINLQTANATTRMREIGIKKSFGFTRRSLMNQFLLESMILTTIAALIGFVIAQLFLPVFNNIIGTPIVESVFSNVKLNLFILGTAILTGLLSGIYPALVISSFNPIKALKEQHSNSQGRGVSLKKILVVSQFSIAVFLLITSFVVYRQTNFMMNKDLGFDSQNVMYASITSDKISPFDQFRSKLLQNPEIEEACFSDYIPFILPGGNDCSWEGVVGNEKVFVRYYRISYDFFSTYQLKITKGRTFTRDFSDNPDACVINETAARVFGWKEPLDKYISSNSRKYHVIGVIKDFLPQYHSKIEPQMFTLYNESQNWTRIFSVQYQKGQFAKAKEVTQREFAAMLPNDVVEFKPVSALVQNDNTLKIWKVFRNICMLFSIITIIISSIGLFGLVLFYVKRKLREICIRKVLGFSVINLYLNLLSEFFWLILISNVIAWPAGYVVYKFLPGAYKYNIQIWEFLLAASIIMVVAIATISYNILKSVRSNPADVLKYE